MLRKCAVTTWTTAPGARHTFRQDRNTHSMEKMLGKTTLAVSRCAAAIAAGALLIAWGQQSAAVAAGETLRQYADKLGFGVGVFIQPLYWKKDPEHKAIMGREFNRAITFAVMIQSERGHFNFQQMDEEMNFAKEHQMKLFGAALIYRTISSPAWLHFRQPDCGVGRPKNWTGSSRTTCRPSSVMAAISTTPGKSSTSRFPRATTAAGQKSWDRIR